jgi:inner membrane protein involved in colicin E2 resistance
MRHAFVAIVGERILWMLQQRRLFLTYFLFEALIAKSLHPALYALVSMARTIFYLLLLCLAEQAGFDLSFPIAVLT